MTALISDQSKGEALRQVGDVNYKYGMNSPYPADTQAPVPSATFQVAGDVENLYRIGNVARIETRTEDGSEDRIIFGGRFSASSDMAVSSMSIDHQSNLLNKDIQTWPIVTDKSMDTSNGRRTMVGALRHWYAECGLTEFGVRGDFYYNATNAVPNVPYLDSATNLIMYYDSINKDIVTEIAEPHVSDPGMSFNTGETATIILKTNNNFGKTFEGEYAPTLPYWETFIRFNASRSNTAGGEEANSRYGVVINYTYATRVIKFTEFVDIGGTGEWTASRETSMNNNDPVNLGSVNMLIMQMTRLSETNIKFDFEVRNRSTTKYYTHTSNFGRAPMNLSLAAMFNTMVDTDYSSPNVQAKEGVQATYIIQSADYSINKEDEFPIEVPWFSTTKYKNIVVPGLAGNAWSMIHDLCSAFGLQFEPVYGKYSAIDLNNYGVPWNTNQGSEVYVAGTDRELSERVEVVNYNYKSTPPFGSRITMFKADQVYSVEKNQVVEEIIQLPEGTTFNSVHQPEASTPTDVINRYKAANSSSSRYSVFDDDNTEVYWDLWNKAGGSITLEPTENLGELKMKIFGPTNDLISKGTTFYISVAGQDIPGLIIAGNGVAAEKETVSIKTGAGKARNLNEVGTTYDNPLVSNLSIAYSVGAGLANIYGSTETKAVGKFPAPEATRFEVAPILKHGSYYAPVSISYQDGVSIQVDDTVRYTPVRWMKDSYTNMTCAQFQATWTEGTICRQVNISPLGDSNRSF